MENIYDVVIVGAGPAGMTAAIYAVRANMKTVMLDRLSPGGQMINTNEIENYTGTGKLNGAELAMKMFEHTQELGAEFDYKTVVNITDEGEFKSIVCEEDNTSYKARAVILATGTTPRRLGVPGEDRWAGNGISWCAICDGPQYRGKEVVVIGGGNSAIEESLYLSDICSKVTIVTMLDLTADPKACGLLCCRSNVDVHIYKEVLEFTGEDHLTGVRFKSTGDDQAEHYVTCDGVFEYIGFQASSQAFEGLGVTDKTGCIPVDAFMNTSVPGVFGAGDITTKHLRQIVTACSDGAIAASSAASYVKKMKNEG